LKQEQEKDPSLAIIRNYAETRIQPTEAELFIQSKASKNYWTKKSLFKMENSILYYHWEDDSDHSWLYVVPNSLRTSVLNLPHNNPTSGHMGQDKTFLNLVRRVFWYGMRQDVVEHVKTCSPCNVSKKANRKSKFPLQSYHAGVPMERVHLDILGPFQVSRSGNRYLLVMVDQFTKWVEIEPLPEQSAELIAKAAVDRFFSHFGYPVHIHTDQGRNFDGKLFSSLCHLLHIAKSRTTPYRPSSNGQVERYNRTILQIIRSYLDKNFQQWDEYIQLVAAAIRSTVNRTTGYTPNMLMLGKEVRLPLDLMLGIEGCMSADQPEYLKGLQQAIIASHDGAREQLKSCQKRQKQDYDFNVRTNHFGVGDIVYLLDSSTKIRQSTKRRPVYKARNIW
jgi:transposase InsO family protein